MAQKIITDLQLADEVTDEMNLAADDTIQTYRVTASQLRDYIDAFANPPGTVKIFAGNTLPTGYLWSDGAAVSRSTYAALFAAIGTSHGSGNGSTTFNLPDYRGRFLRGTDTMGSGAATRDPDKAGRTAMASGGNTGDTVGSVQTEAFKEHTHAQNAHSHAGDAHRHELYGRTNSTAGSSTRVMMANGATGSPVNLPASDPEPMGSATQASGPATATNQNAGGSESRPVNANVNYIIKT